MGKKKKELLIRSSNKRIQESRKELTQLNRFYQKKWPEVKGFLLVGIGDEGALFQAMVTEEALLQEETSFVA